jgi:membrane associated rhomboid family serine protease
MWPRLGSSKLVERWIIATLGISIVAALDGGIVASWLGLAPARVWRGEVWRLVTWPLVEVGPLQLVLTCAAIYKFGGELAVRWGDRRLRRFVLEIVLAASLVTCILAALTGASWLFRLGGWAVSDLLVIAWARQFPGAVLNIQGMLRLSGRGLIQFTVGVAILFALFAGPVVMAPELVACLAAALYPQGWLRR